MTTTAVIHRTIDVLFIFALLFAGNVLRPVAAEVNSETVVPINDATQSSPVAVSVVGSVATLDMNEQTPWWLEPFVTGFGIVLGTIIIVWRIGAEYRRNLKLQKENARNELNLTIYNDIADKVAKASDAVGKLSIWTFSIPYHVQMYQEMVRHSNQHGAYTPTPIQQRAAQFHNMKVAAGNEVPTVMLALERYEIALPNFKIFRLALSETTHHGEKVAATLFSELLRFLPMDMPHGPPHVPDLPSGAQFELLKQHCNQYWKITSDIQTYLSDLIVEAQNHLLGDLFPNHRVPRRQPQDRENYKVISTDEADIRQLVEHFRNISDHPEQIIREEWYGAGKGWS